MAESEDLELIVDTSKPPVALVVMRNIRDLPAYQDTLSMIGYEVMTPSSPEQAEALLAEKSNILLIIVEHNFPQMKGLDLLQKARKSLAQSSSLILLSPNDNVEFERRYLTPAKLTYADLEKNRIQYFNSLTFAMDLERIARQTARSAGYTSL